MPPARLLALAVCGYLTPALRKTVRVQPCGCNRHHSNTVYRKKLLSFPVPHGLPLRSAAAAMSMTRTARDGERITGATDENGQEVVGLDTAAEVYRYLRGCWDLEKSIDYRAGGMAGTWHGTAKFTPQESSSSTATSAAIPKAEHRARRQGNHEASGIHVAETFDSGSKPSPLLLRYLEHGTFRVNGKGEGFEAGQRLVYDCGDESGADPVRVHFVDDPSKPDNLRFFHELEFRRPSAAAVKEAGGVREGSSCGELAGKAVLYPRAEFEHLCVRDMYRGQVEVVGPDEFTTRYVSLVGRAIHAVLHLLLGLGRVQGDSAFTSGLCSTTVCSAVST